MLGHSQRMRGPSGVSQTVDQLPNVLPQSACERLQPVLLRADRFAGDKTLQYVWDGHRLVPMDEATIQATDPQAGAVQLQQQKKQPHIIIQQGPPPRLHMYGTGTSGHA